MSQDYANKNSLLQIVKIQLKNPEYYKIVYNKGNEIIKAELFKEISGNSNFYHTFPLENG